MRRLSKLTALAVNRMTQPGYYGDGGGLWLQVSPTGTKSWIFRYTLSGKSREMGLGPLHTVSLADARHKAMECRQLLLDGRDPLEVRRASRSSKDQARLKTPTFDQCAEAYIEAHRASWKNEKHIKQWIATITTYASPVLGNVTVDAVDTALSISTPSPGRVLPSIRSISGWRYPRSPMPCPIRKAGCCSLTMPLSRCCRHCGR